MKFYLRNHHGDFVASHAMSPKCSRVADYLLTAKPAAAEAFNDYRLALQVAHDITRTRELCHGSDLNAIFSPCVWLPELNKFVPPCGLEFLAHVARLEFALASALPHLERQLAAQGDAPDFDLLTLQHHLATLLQSPGHSQPEPTTKP